MDIHSISEYIVKSAMTHIQNKQQNTGKEGLRSVSYGFEYDLSEEAIINTKIQSINILLYVNLLDENQKNKINGKFKANETKLNTNNNFNVSIEITINLIPEDTTKLEKFIPKIESVVSHELNHAFVYVKKFGKHAKSQVYNASSKFTRQYYSNIPALKEFIDMFYLNLPEEIQARVQETATILKSINYDNYQDVIKELYLYQPINDAKKMSNYNDDNVNQIDIETLTKFIDSFNKDVNLFKTKFGTNYPFKQISNVDQFFDYWTSHIKAAGKKLNRKILKLVAQKFNINEEYLLAEIIDEDIFTEIFGD